jgi:ferredoxin
MPIFTRIIPVEKELKIPQEKTLPLHEASKIIDQQEIISVSECPCKLDKALLGDPCKTTTERFRCFHFGNLGRYFIEHGFGKLISKSEAKRLLRDAEEDGLVHKTFHDDFDIHNNENSICNCCKCCCIIFQGYYRGIFPFHTRTSYIAKINENKCAGSGTCIDKCPLGANSLINGKAHLDELKCIGCGICVHHCPEHARSLEKTSLMTVFILPPKLEG